MGRDGDGATGQPSVVTRYLALAYRGRWLILGSLVATLVAGLVITLLTTPLYTASARLEISRVGNRIVNVQEVQPETSAIDNEFYQTQYGILESRSLADQVARNLRLADDRTFFEMFGEDDAVEALSGQGGGGQARTAEDRQRIAVDVLLRNVRISPIRLSRLVDVQFTSPSPQFSAQVTNAWANAFIQFNLQRRFEATSYARQFLEQRLGQVRQRLENSERELVAYASRESLINLPSGQAAGPNGQVQTQERSLIANSLSELNSALAIATADRVRAESRLSSSGRLGANSEALQNTAITGLRQRRAEAAAEYSRLMTQFTADYPPVAALAAQISQLDRSISNEERRVQDSIRNAYQDAVQREQALQNRVRGLQANYLDERRRGIQYNIFQRDADTNRELYNGLLQRYKEIGVAGGVGENNVQIVDQARVPEKPSRPRLLLNMLLSLIAGLILGAIVVLLREQIDDTFNDPADVESQIELPLLGVLPKSRDEAPLEELLDPKSAIMEAVLSTQSNLEFSTDHGFPRSLAVTSTRPAEGKSTTAQALAFVVGRQGGRTLLIDADMRSPSLHSRLGVPNAKGLSNYLSGLDNLQSLVQQASDQPFAVLTAGPQPPNAAELLRGNGFNRLIAEAGQHYDCVVIDAPPVMGLADAPIIASATEATIFIIEAHGTRTRAVRQALQRLRVGRARLLGCVLAKFEPRRGTFAYGNSYGYGYGYGYGSETRGNG